MVQCGLGSPARDSGEILVLMNVGKMDRPHHCWGDRLVAPDKYEQIKRIEKGP